MVVKNLSPWFITMIRLHTVPRPPCCGRPGPGRRMGRLLEAERSDPGYRPALSIQACGQFIQHQNLGSRGKDARNRHPPFLSARKIKRRGIVQRFRKTYHLKRLFCSLPALLIGKSLIPRSKAYVAQNIHFKQLVLRILKIQPYLLPEGLQNILPGKYFLPEKFLSPVARMSPSDAGSSIFPEPVCPIIPIKFACQISRPTPFIARFS